MKKVFVFLIVLFSIVSCDKIFKENDIIDTEDSTKDYSLGGDKDEYGCIESAGYTWSILRNDCIRVFEVGYRLNSVNQNTSDAVLSSFIIFNEKKDKAELFLPNNKASIILNKKADDLFENGKIEFNAKEFYLTVDHVKKYEAAIENLKNIEDNHEEEIEEEIEE